MIDITSYILEPLEKRKSHLKLNERCIDRGGKDWTSVFSKGLLAHILDTTIPLRVNNIHLCHACNNGQCSNPYHQYWGTPRENRLDAIAAGGISNPWEYAVAKYGLDGARERNKRKGNQNGSGNKGKAKSKEHNAKVSEAIRRLHAKGRYKEIS